MLEHPVNQGLAGALVKVNVVDVFLL